MSYADSFGPIRLHADVIREAAQNHGTPLWFYLPQQSAAAIHRIRNAAGKWGDATAAYSLKTNPASCLLRDIEQAGAAVEVVSSWEFAVALRAGFPPERIIFNGPLKTAESLRVAVNQPLRMINIDSLDELSLIETVATEARTPVPVGVRVKPSGRASRFGLDVDEATLAVHRIRDNPRLRLAGLHIHLGTQVEEESAYVAAVREARNLWDGWDLTPEMTLDIGGGFPFRHDLPAEQQPFDVGAFFRKLATAWGSGPRPRLIVEPGRIVAAPAFALVSRVLSVRERRDGPAVVVVDSGINHNITPMFHEHRWSFLPDDGPPREFMVCGPLCMEEDILAAPRRAPLPGVGALAVTWNAGAYSIALSRTFIQPRPPIVAVEGEDRLRLVEPRESFEDAYAIRVPPEPSARQATNQDAEPILAGRPTRG